MLQKYQKKYKGFTLLELLIVITIIAILAAVITLLLVGSLAKSRDSQRIREANAIAEALRYYYLDHKEFPAESDGYSGTGYPGYIGMGNPIDTALEPYMGFVPADPKHDGTDYFYYYDANHSCSSDGDYFATVLVYSFETDDYDDKFNNFSDICSSGWGCEPKCRPDYVIKLTPNSP